ncbi:MAG: hypothetical protein HC796_12085 [Synechococcaceae cyanobacterium RL_1_2]|nr:hypothetical protein [Synechococcaceae cyanobacterium RL_1_2]
MGRREKWLIEEYHRGLKQCCGVERAQVRSSRSQRNQIGFALRDFLGLEIHWFRAGISGDEAKLLIIQEAIRSYLAPPSFTSTCVSPDHSESNIHAIQG